MLANIYNIHLGLLDNFSRPGVCLFAVVVSILTFWLSNRKVWRSLITYGIMSFGIATILMLLLRTLYRLFE